MTIRLNFFLSLKKKKNDVYYFKKNEELDLFTRTFNFIIR